MRPEQAVLSDARFLATLIEINHEITSILDLDQLLRKIAELPQRIVPYQIFAIFLLDESRQQLYLRLAVGHSPEIAPTLSLPTARGLVGTTPQHVQPALP